MDGGRNNQNYNYPQNDGYQGHFQQSQVTPEQNQYDQQGYAYNPNMQGYNQQNTYQQSNVKQKKVYNNPFNRVGNHGLNMMIYMVLAAMMFMSGSTTALTILFVAVFILEKDNEVNKVLATLLVEVFALCLVQDVWYLVYNPIFNGLTGLMDIVDYYGAVYDIAEFLMKAVGFVNKTINWVCSLLFIVLGALNLSNITKGKFKIPKIVNKYFE